MLIHGKAYKLSMNYFGLLANKSINKRQKTKT